MKTDERLFEDAIEEALLAKGGYSRSDPAHFDRALGLDPTELFAFIDATQPKEWARLVVRYGSDESAARTGFLRRLCKELDTRGTIQVLRHGISDQGVQFRLAYFKPAHRLTPELVKLYDANRLTVTRQLHYDPSSEKSLDLGLLVNGIPTATAELKNPITGQTVEDAIAQYRKDRDPKNVTLSRRAVVHFAVDPELVFMTSQLDGGQTRFLPFNLGHDGGAGNPPSPNGHQTSYLWETVWVRDSWLDILGRFVKSEPVADSRTAKVSIFPRYHQLDAVRKLEAAARSEGAGHNYLVEHSAGSGKSLTIGWLAYRLMNLHDESDSLMFDKVIVVTDRRVLDSQLQETISQIEHTRGVVKWIDKKSAQLAEALRGEEARVIITTLQKFPFILEEIGGLPDRHYAVIVDEAHSSQTGETAKELRLVLGDTEEQELTAAEAEDAGLVAYAVDPVEEALAKAVLARGKQKNLSFFAFTATPKAKTLELFGTWDPVEKRFGPSHLYSMRQAIEEGFILNVLTNYTTYDTYWRIEKAILEDPTYPEREAKRAIARFVSLHPTNLAQKAEVIVEHFRQHVQHQLRGKAKAMVVTSSRLHAVRYKQTIDKYIRRMGYTDLATLVAFSGTVTDITGASFTEQGMNKFPESQTATEFDGDGYQVLIVAEKFQTGFDQPLLVAMYVDKLLMGLNAVQTLSRLNRIYPGKTNVFVLDFRNTTDEILKAFKPYYGETVAPPTDPNVLADTRARLDDFDVLRPAEIDVAVAFLVGDQDPRNHGKVYAWLEPAVERFRALPAGDKLEFLDALNRFVRTYTFVSHLVSFGDTHLERDYRYCRMLAAMLRSTVTGGGLNLGSEVELSHLRLEVASEGAITLEPGDGEVKSLFGDGSGPDGDPKTAPLSQVIEELNERFGLELNDRDRLLFEQFEETWTADQSVIDQAQNNSLENFRLVFDRMFMKTVVARMDQNEAIFKKIIDDEEFQKALIEIYAKRIYRRAQGNSGSSDGLSKH